MMRKLAMVTVLGVGMLGATATQAKPGKPQMATAGVTRQAPAKAAPARTLTKQEKIAAFKALVRALGKVPRSCRFKGKRLYGKIKVVTSFPDFKVKRVTSFPDLKVKWVTSFPDSCGKWQKVTSFPDFKIQWVTSFPDFTIQTVTSFPGVN